MRLKLIIIGVVLIIFSIPGYIYSPHMMSDYMDSTIGTQDSTLGTNILQQMAFRQSQ